MLNDQQRFFLSFHPCSAGVSRAAVLHNNRFSFFFFAASAGTTSLGRLAVSTHSASDSAERRFPGRRAGLTPGVHRICACARVRVRACACVCLRSEDGSECRRSRSRSAFRSFSFICLPQQSRDTRLFLMRAHVCAYVRARVRSAPGCATTGATFSPAELSACPRSRCHAELPPRLPACVFFVGET